jgi:hypothetical protein
MHATDRLTLTAKMRLRVSMALRLPSLRFHFASLQPRKGAHRQRISRFPEGAQIRFDCGKLDSLSGGEKKRKVQQWRKSEKKVGRVEAEEDRESRK